MSEVLVRFTELDVEAMAANTSRKRAAPLHQTDCGKAGSSFSRRPQPFEPSARRRSRIAPI